MGTPAQIRRRGRLGLLVGGVVAALAFAAVASADDIPNNLDASVDAVAEVMPLNVGGASGTTQLRVVTQNGDGKNGCNLTGSATLVVSVTSSNPAAATVSPASVTFGSCGDVKTLTVTPHAQGSATVSLAQVSNDTGATFNLAPATFTVTVAPPANTAPAVSVAGVSGGASYAQGAVPAAVCQVTDAEDGASSFAATLGAITGPYAADGLGQQIASCSYTDAGGLTASASESYSVIDPSEPTIAYVVSPAAPDGANGWYRGGVTLTWTVVEAESPSSLAKAGCIDQAIAADQVETVYSCSATSAGGASGPVTIAVKRDGTAPTVLCGTADALWHADDVAILCTAFDALSQLLDTADASFVLSTSVADGNETDAAATGSRAVADIAGNVSVVGPIGGIRVDKKAPAIACAPAPSDWSATDVAIGCAASDGGAGLASPGDASFSLSTSVAEGVETDSASTQSKDVADAVGNVATSGPVTGLKVDRKAPAVDCDTADGAWHATNVAVACTASDGGSGLADAADASFALATNVPAGMETSDASTNGRTVSDAVGNAASAGPVGGNRIDRKGPSVIAVCPSTVLMGATAAASWTATDGGSGVAAGHQSGTVTGLDTSSVGTKTATVPAASSQDAVGNASAAVMCTYAVIYRWAGFFQPIDNLPTQNSVKAGSAVPVKFSLGGYQGMSVLAAGYPTSNVAACDAAAGDDPLETTLTAGSSGLSYDAASDQYLYVWKTDKAWAGTCRQLRVKLADGTVHAANFKLK